jgi:hypothetical protein
MGDNGIATDCFVLCDIADPQKDLSIYQYRGSLMFIGFRLDLISEGWIEEVKPREWWMVEFQSHTGDWILSSVRYYNPDLAREAACNYAGNPRFIKVREVIE